jgi:hypothetical protein
VSCGFLLAETAQISFGLVDTYCERRFSLFVKPVNPVTCPECSSSSFRLSRFRLKDFERLLLLQYPVRCRHCHRRVYAGLPLALVLLQASRVRRERRSHEATH